MSARKFLLLLLVLAVLCAGIYYVFLRSPPDPAGQEQATPVPVPVSGLPHDGDTLRVEGSVSVRILGIDAPEVPPAGTDCYGQEAQSVIRALLANQEVLLTSDPAQPDADRYNRLLRYVEVQGTADVGAFLVEYGFARVYEQYPVQRTGEYLRLQEQARQAKRGGWSACSW